jgi:prepilin peptidase CpaA
MIPTVFIFLIIQLLFVSLLDAKYRKISNNWSLLNIGIYLLFIIFFPSILSFEWQTLILSGAFLVLGFMLFLLKIMGGGDAKYLTTFTLLIPVKLHLLFLEYLLIGTILFAGFFFIKNIIQNRSDIINYLRSFYLQGVKSFFGTKFAFAPVILVAWILLGLDIYFNLI